MRRQITAAVDLADFLASQVSLRCLPEAPCLSTFLFHSIFRNRREIELNIMDPQQQFTLDHFRTFVEYFLHQDYTFVSPNEALLGLNPRSKSAMITFDDGYFNNHLVLPLLHEYEIPAVFFISTRNILDNKPFWWDVLYREGLEGSKGQDHLAWSLRHFKTRRADEIEAELVRCYGQRALQPIGDIDRPFTASELADFARDRLVFLGNHTADHAILTNYDRADMAQQIASGQRSIVEITGLDPQVISYPNGDYSIDVVDVCREMGFKLGITTEPRKNRIPVCAGTSEALRLGRFVLYGREDLVTQCQYCRSGRFLLTRAERLLRRTKRSD